MTKNPDTLCRCPSNTPMNHRLTESDQADGYSGQIVSSTLDACPRLIARTAPAFIDGFLFHSPDFDDPALQEKAFLLNNSSLFHTEFQHRLPGS